MLLLGALRPDKFSYDEFRALVAALNEAGFDGELRLCCRPRITVVTEGLRFKIRNLSTDDVIPDDVVLRELGGADIMLAPYRNPTDSGTVRLAATAGLRIVAYRSGAYADLLPPEDLVDPGDVQALARTAASWRSRVSGASINASDSEVAEAWKAILEVHAR
jgi:hypothetical protein